MKIRFNLPNDVGNSTGNRKSKIPGSAALRAALISATLLLSRMPEANAEPLLKIEEIRMDGFLSVDCKQVTLKQGANPFGAAACLNYPEEGYSPILYLEKPSEAIIEIYPFVHKVLFDKTGETLISLIYLMDGKEIKSHVKVKPSELNYDGSGFDMPEGMMLATPVRLVTAGVGDKPMEIYIAEPNGAITINQRQEGDDLALIALVPIQPEDETIPEVPLSEKTDSGKKIIPKPIISEEEPAEPVAVEQPEKSPLVSLESERLIISKAGEFGNSGDISDVRLLVAPRLNDNISLVVGVSAGLQNILVSDLEAETSIRLITGTGIAGIDLDFGKHSVFAQLFGGASYVTPAFRSFIHEGRSSDYSFVHGEIGGMAGYDYDNMFGLVLQGGSNPLSIARARLYASLPYSWASAYPRLEIDGRYLHLMKPTEGEKIGASLDQGHLLVDTSLKVPIYDIGPVLPSIIAGYRWGKDLENSRGIEGGPENIYVGAAIKALITDTVRLEVAGAYMFNNSYMVLLNAAYLR